MNGSSHFPELWSAQDALDLTQFQHATSRDNLAAALFSIEGADPETIALGLAQLDTWAALVTARLHPSTNPPDNPTPPEEITPEAQRAALHQVLGQELELSGDREDYYHPRNSALSEVLRRRKGLPIVLACVWMLVGKRAGITVEGIGLPGHFLVRIGGEHGVLADPFEGGIALDTAACQHIVHKLSHGSLCWRDDYLDAIDTKALLERVLRNLVCTHERRQEPRALYRSVRFMTALCPTNSDVHILHAHLAEALGDTCTAQDLYQRICEQFAGSDAARVSIQRLESICRLHRLLN